MYYSKKEDKNYEKFSKFASHYTSFKSENHKNQ